MGFLSSGERLPWASYLLIAAIIVPLSLPFATKYLWEPDSVNYALALERFDLSEHVPHPPGYLFFVLVVRAVNALVGEPNRSLILVSVAANVITACLVAWLATQMAGRWVGLCAALLLIFNHIFWYYGHLSTIYPIEGLAGTAVACSAYRSLRGDRGWAAGSGLVLGLAGGFRGMIVPLLFPLWAYCLVARRRRPGAWVLPVGALALGFAAWFVPTCLATGGLEVYRAESRQLFLYNLRITSLFLADEPLKALGKNFIALSAFSLMGLSYLGLVAAGSLSLTRAGRRWARELLGDRRRLAFFGLWMGPPLLFYFLTHLPKPGYLMTFLPGLQLLVGWLLVASWGRFFAGGSTTMPAYLGMLLAAHILLTVVIHLRFAQRLMIRPANEALAGQLAVARSSLCPEPSDCLLLVHKVSWRQLYYYLPQYTVGALIDEEVALVEGYGAEVGWAKGRKARYATGRVIWTTYPRPAVQQVPVPKRARVVIWYLGIRDSEFFRALQEALPLHGPLIDNPDQPDNAYYTRREEMKPPLRVGAFRFVEEDGPPPEERWWAEGG